MRGARSGLTTRLLVAGLLVFVVLVAAGDAARMSGLSIALPVFVGPSPSTGSAAIGSPVPTQVGAAPKATPSPSPSATASTGPPTAAPSGGARPPAEYVSHGSRSVRSIALTFDDGWNVPACRSIVGTLLDSQVPATFFPNAMYVRENPSFWHWVASQGFPVGSHATTHRDLTTLSSGARVQELVSGRRIDDAALGVPSIPILRPPFGAYNAAVLEAAGEAGYSLVVGWDVDSRDWAGGSVGTVVSNSTRGTDGSIILLHCGSGLTPLALPAIIAHYRASGFAFVTIPGMFSLPLPTAPYAATAHPADILATALDLAPADVSVWNTSIATGPDGTIHAAYESPDGIWYATQEGTGPLVRELVAASTATSFAMHPSLALDRDGGAHMTYVVASASGFSAYYQARSAGGWEAPVHVSPLDAPASTTSVAVAPDGSVWVAYVRVLGSSSPGIWLARRSVTGWVQTPLHGTNGTDLNPALVFSPDGAAHVFTRRNGYSEMDEITWPGRGAASTAKVIHVSTSAISFAGYDLNGRLWLAYQATDGPEIRLGSRVGGTWTWRRDQVTAEGDLSGLAVTPSGVCIVFERSDGAGVSHPLVACP